MERLLDFTGPTDVALLDRVVDALYGNNQADVSICILFSSLIIDYQLCILCYLIQLLDEVLACSGDLILINIWAESISAECFNKIPRAS